MPGDEAQKPMRFLQPLSLNILRRVLSKTVRRKGKLTNIASAISLCAHSTRISLGSLCYRSYCRYSGIILASPRHKQTGKHLLKRHPNNHKISRISTIRFLKRKALPKELIFSFSTGRVS